MLLNFKQILEIYIENTLDFFNCLCDNNVLIIHFFVVTKSLLYFKRMKTQCQVTFCHHGAQLINWE